MPGCCDVIVCLSLLYGKIDPHSIRGILLDNSLDQGSEELAEMLSQPGGVQDIWRHVQREHPRWTNHVQHFRPDDQGLRWAAQLVIDGQVRHSKYSDAEPTFDNLSLALEQIINDGWNHAVMQGYTRGPTRKRSFVRTRETEAMNMAGRAFPHGNGRGNFGHPGGF